MLIDKQYVIGHMEYVIVCKHELHEYKPERDGERERDRERER